MNSAGLSSSLSLRTVTFDAGKEFGATCTIGFCFDVVIVREVMETASSQYCVNILHVTPLNASGLTAILVFQVQCRPIIGSAANVPHDGDTPTPRPAGLLVCNRPAKPIIQLMFFHRTKRYAR